ncbi:MAG: SpoIIE family protein phosphatase, partial [Actinobacteria bacterium]|nr:SpoIIE family protein phosphatase [Actinomycetota bacterium]
ELARELRRRYPPAPEADHPIPRVIATGKSDLVSHIGDDDLAVQAFDDEHRATLEALGTRSHMVVPIAARGRILGAISFVSGVPGRYSEGDLQVAEDLAARAALAVDNARLYREAQDTALRAQEALALLDALVDRAPIGFAFLDRDLRFVRVNETMARMDGVPAEEHFGRRLGQVVPNLDPVASESMQRVLATGRPVVNVEHPGPGPGVAGRPWFWSSSFYPVRSEQGLLGVGMVVADISHRKQTEQRLAAQSAVARILAESDTVADAAPRVLMALCHHLRWDVGHLWVVDEAGDRLRYVAGWHDPTAGLEGFVRESAETTFPRGVGLPGRAWASATPEWVEDVRDETVFPRAAVAAPLGLRTGVAFPMAIGTQVLGVIELLGRTPRARDEDAIDLKAAIGNQLGQFVERKGAEEAVRESEERLRLALDAGRMGTWRWDLATGGVAWDETLEALFGLDAGTFGGTYEDYLELLHPDDRAWVVEAIDRSVSTRSGHHFEHRAVRRGGEVRWLEAWGWVTLGPEGAVTGMTGVAVDVTERRLAEEERSKLLALEQAAREGAERAQRRLAFLAEASAVLGSSLDYRSTLRRVAELAVPTLADWCAVDMVDPEGRLQSLAVAHIDPDKARFAEELRRRYPPDADAPSGTARVARTGEPEMVEDIPEEAIEAAARDEEHLRLLRELRLRSYMCVPITARGRVLGTLTLVFAESGRRFGPTDLELAGALAARAAVAVENARLYEERSYVARTLQRSLLPPQLPEVPGFQLAARYHAAGEGNEVGGDFYDVFDTGDGGWGFIMGDVCGRGADAAALTGLARHTIRAAAMRDRRPSQILATLNEAIIQQRSDQSFCTVCYVRVHPGDDGGARLTVACGGHPLPLVLRRDGSVEETGTPGTLIGVFPDPEIADRPTDLDPGDVLVLYTDGVTESRGGRGIYGEDRLRAVLSSCVGLDAATVAERIEEDVLRHKPDASDDIAILVARLEG